MYWKYRLVHGKGWWVIEGMFLTGRIALLLINNISGGFMEGWGRMLENAFQRVCYIKYEQFILIPTTYMFRSVCPKVYGIYFGKYIFAMLFS